MGLASALCTGLAGGFIYADRFDKRSVWTAGFGAVSWITLMHPFISAARYVCMAAQCRTPTPSAARYVCMAAQCRTLKIKQHFKNKGCFITKGGAL